MDHLSASTVISFSGALPVNIQTSLRIIAFKLLIFHQLYQYIVTPYMITVLIIPVSQAKLETVVYLILFIIFIPGPVIKIWYGDDLRHLSFYRSEFLPELMILSII